MGQVIQVNGDYTIKARRAGGANVTFDTGEQVGSVTVTGDLRVLGTSHTFNSQVISDVVLVLNRGETGPGVTLRRSGIEIDRGSHDRADFLFDEQINAWTITNKLTDGTYSYDNSNLQVRNILADVSTDNGDLTLISTGTGVVKVAGTSSYETRVLDYTRLPSVVITHISRSASTNLITVTTSGAHGLSVNDYIDIHCATFPAFNASNRLILDKTNTTIKYASTGIDFANTPVSGYVIKNSLMWLDGSSYVATDDYIPNMRAVSDYSRSLVDAAIINFSTSHIEDQNSRIDVYDSETSGGTSYVKVTVDGIEKISVISAGITTPATDFDLLNTNATTVNFAGAGTAINVGSGTVSTTTNLKNATINVGNGTTSSITTPATTFNLVNANATNVNFAGAGTAINIGSDAVSTTTNLKNATVNVGNGIVSAITTPAATFSLINTNATTVNFAGDGTTIAVGSATTGTTTSLKNSTVAIGNGSTSAITTPSTTFNLVDANALTVNFAGAGTAINVGSDAVSTTTNLKNATVNIGNGTVSAITTPVTTFNLVNANATTVNFAGAGTAINIGSDAVSTTTNLKNATVNIGNGTVSAITTPAATFSLVDTNATTVEFAGAGTTINVGSDAVSTTTNLKNATVNIGNGTVSAITTPATSFNLVNTTATEVDFAGDGTTINIGSATSGTTSLKNTTLAVGSGTSSSITTPAATFDLINTTATTVNFAGAATEINVGSALPGTTTINHDLVVAGTITFNGGATQISSTVLSVDDPLLYLADNNVGDTVDIGLVGAYNFVAPPGTHPHAGFVRDATDKVWKLFSGTSEPVGNIIDFTGATYDNLKIGGLTATSGSFSSDVSGVKGTFTGDVAGVKGTFTGDVAGVKGIFSGDVSGVKGTFTGDVSGAKGTFTGKLTASGGAEFTGTVTGITALMVGAYTKSEADGKIADVAAGLAAGDVSVSITSASGSSVELSTASGVLTVDHGGTGVTTKTGTGKVVLSDSPTLVTPVLGSATATSLNKVILTQPTTTSTLTLYDNSSLITDGANSLTLKTTLDTIATFPTGNNNTGIYTVGYLNMPQYLWIANDATSTIDDSGCHILHTSTAGNTYTINNNVNYPIGTVLTIINDSGAADVTIVLSGGAMVLAGVGVVASSSVTLAADGITTAIKTTDNKWLINGVGMTVV